VKWRRRTGAAVEGTRTKVADPSSCICRNPADRVPATRAGVAGTSTQKEATGETGATGGPGKQGKQGEQGPQGERGFDEIVRPTASFSTGSSSLASKTVTCPTTHPRVIAGGVETPGNLKPFARVVDSFPAGTDAWTVTLWNEGGGLSFSSTAYAICVQ